MASIEKNIDKKISDEARNLTDQTLMLLNYVTNNLEDFKDDLVAIVNDDRGRRYDLEFCMESINNRLEEATNGMNIILRALYEEENTNYDSNGI